MGSVLVSKDVVVCGDLAETLATVDLPEVGVVEEEADDSPVLADAVAAVVPEWWVSVAFALFVVLAANMCHVSKQLWVTVLKVY